MFKKFKCEMFKCQRYIKHTLIISVNRMADRSNFIRGWTLFIIMPRRGAYLKAVVIKTFSTKYTLFG